MDIESGAQVARKEREAVGIKELTDAYIEVAKRGDAGLSYAWSRISELEQEFKVLMWQGNKAQDIDNIIIDGENVYYMNQDEVIVERDIRELAFNEIMAGPGFKWIGRKSKTKPKGFMLGIAPRMVD